MKKTMVTLFVCSIPIFLFFTVWQSYRYSSLEQQVKNLELTQKKILEENKKTVMGIEFLKSPYRINKIAEEDLKLEKIDPNKVIRIEIDEKEANIGE